MPTLKVKNNGIWETVSGIGGSGGSGGSGVAVQSDYTQNDSTAMDYIKNRPFYAETTTIFDQDVTTKIEEDTPEGFSFYNHPVCIVDYETLEDGDVFIVQMDGETYSCESNDKAIGNLYFMYEAFLSMGLTEEQILEFVPEAANWKDTGEPFLIMFNYNVLENGTVTESTDFVFKESAVTTHHFVIDGGVIHKLDKKFLPKIDALPPVTASNDGQILGVVNGAWATTDAPSTLPEVTTADNDKVLMVINGAWVAGSIANGDEVYY